MIEERVAEVLMELW
ncbi:TPA: hypothetical protein ACSEJ5_001779 [Streptococcus pyogenes]